MCSLIGRVILLACVALLALSGCAAPQTYADTIATAQVAGCWPGNELPPPPVTVTPYGAPTPTAPNTTPADYLPTMTPLPTTTPYVRCTPAPGETQKPWPTPLPPRPEFPTLPAMNQPRSSEMQTIMQLPDAILSVDMAVNPVTGDPVVAAIAAPLTSAGLPHAFVRAYNGRTKTWGTVQNVDVKPAEIAHHRFRTVAITVSGDGAITVVWGATAYPAMGLWASISRDNGETWGEPQHLTDNAFGVLDVASTLDGQIAVLALRREPTTPIVITRNSDGVWSQPDPIPVSSTWYGSSGSIVVTGTGDVVRVVALTTGFKEAPGYVFLAARSLNGTDAWRVGTRQVDTPQSEGLVGNVRGLAATISTPEGGSQSRVAFTFALRSAPDAYAVVSNDGGTSWSDITKITRASDPTSDVAPFSALAFDPAAQRLVALWTCCEDARWGSKPSTHYGAWSVPGSDDWQPHEQVPVITGAVAAADTVVAQASNTRFAWLAWVENGNTVAARAIDLNHIIATDQYSTATPAPTLVIGEQP